MTDTSEIIKSGAIDKLADLIHKLAGPLAEECGLLLGDKAKLYRLKNWLSVVSKAELLLKNASLPANAVPPRVFLPILESSSLEENETLQDLWAGLLSSASSEADSLSPSFIETLKQLTPGQAIILGDLFKYAEGLADIRESPDLNSWSSEAISSSAVELAKEAFERLGLIGKSYNLQRPNILSMSYQQGNPQLINKKPFVVTLQPTRQLNEGFYLPFQAASGTYDFGQSTTSDEDDQILPELTYKDDQILPELTYKYVFTQYGLQFMRACLGPTQNQPEQK